MIKAKFIGITAVRGVGKSRWECPVCRANKHPECRFNLSFSKDGKTHKCRYCKTELELKVKKMDKEFKEELELEQVNLDNWEREQEKKEGGYDNEIYQESG